MKKVASGACLCRNVLEKGEGSGDHDPTIRANGDHRFATRNCILERRSPLRGGSSLGYEGICPTHFLHLRFVLKSLCPGQVGRRRSESTRD
jgi:hypothetical protein